MFSREHVEKMKFIFTLISVCMVLGHVGFSVETDGVSASVMEGDSITLNTNVETNRQDRIKWYFNGIRIAQINRNQSKICTDVQCNNGNEGFRDRLKLNHQTGSLTIMNIRTEHTGVYQLQIFSSSSSDRTFSVSVHGVSAAARDEMKIKSKKEGDSVTLDPDVMRKPNYVMAWYFNETCISEITGDQCKICTNDQCKNRFRDRLKLDQQTGSLIIMNIRTTDSGLYTVNISSSRFSIIKSFVVALIDSHVETPALDLHPGINKILLNVIIALLVVASAVGVIYSLFRKYNGKRQKYGVDSVSITEGESVTLMTNIEIQRKDQILWKFGDDNTPIAKIKGGYKTSVHDNDDERFRDRLKLDKKTGSLIITNTRTTDAGVYTLQVNRNGKTSFKLSSVSVYVKSVSVMEGDSVTLHVDLTETEKAEQILWMPRTENTCIAEINNLDNKVACYNDALNGKFKYRLQLDHQTGSLTIKNSRITDSGVYQLKIVKNKETSLKLFSVSVSCSNANRIKSEETIVPWMNRLSVASV
ncbi:uncharacterized protein LOC127161161 [Labeo rohita]|uniref:uncharacterized protein LOC127161161 n=1 Tax=Labeo rohita TaxID=84645 RepID=UPI0021E1E328|nr:uncharacterized protein LOC127161161 [Labeo rohita]